jgi:hypothetical protein
LPLTCYERSTVGATAYQEPFKEIPRSFRRRGEQRRRHFQANRLRHDQVNDEVELGRLLDRKIGGLRPPNLVDQVPGAPLKSMKATVPTGVENSYFS